MADYTTKGSFNLGNQITLKNKNSNIDRDYGPYEGKTLAEIATLLEATIQAGKTIGVIENGQVVEYWWQNGEFVKKGGVTETSQIPELETEAKTIVEAINEIKRIQEEGGGVDLTGIEQDIENLQNNKQDKTETQQKFEELEAQMKTPVVQQDGNATIQPNTYNVWGSVAALTITKGTDIAGIVNNYMVRFTAGEGCAVKFLGFTLQWYGGAEPEWVAGNTYEISIVDNIALWAEFEPIPTT